jgi:nitrite reductase/ring-hydroxylating ferredoxin subunit
LQSTSQPRGSETRALSEAVHAPPAERFPTYPTAWYPFGQAREIRHRPVSKDLLGRRLVAFRTAGGQIGVLDAHCSHLGADLGRGCVAGDTVQCPFHNWRYGVDGLCSHIYTGDLIPPAARQRSYPAVERHGLVFFFNGPEALYPLPFFDGADPDDFIRARPFGMTLRCPWWLVGANACDLQHFLGAHDRRLAGPAQVSCPTPYSRRASAPFAVVGASWRDRFTRWVGGPEVELSVTDWSGTMLFVTARFRRTRSYGLLTSLSLGRDSVFVRGIVFVKRSRFSLGRWLLDPVNLWLRRYFIKEFLRPDAELAARGLRYDPDRLLPCDDEMASYFTWLAQTTGGSDAGVAGWTEA